MIKTGIRKILNKLGYEINKKQNGFSINSDLSWLRELKIKTIIDIGANEGQFSKFINKEIPHDLP